MTDAKLDPKSLTAEERAIVDHEASRFHRDWTGEARYQAALGICEPIILARRAIFGGTESEGAKVECPNCGEMASEPHTIPDCLLPMSPSLWTCKPAQPEREISDGCGSTWLKCERANCGLEVVRPGKVQCDVCESMPDEPAAPVEMPFLRDELSRLLNHHSRENHSDTPDFVLAGFLMDALCAWERATSERDTFFGQNPRFAAMVNGPERKQPEPAEPSDRIVLGDAAENRRKREVREVIDAAPREEPKGCPVCGDGNKCWAGTLPVDGAISNLRYAAKNPSVSRDEAERMYKVACNLAHFWRAHSQPAPVRMTPELEDILRWQSQRAKNLRRSPLAEGPRVADDIDTTIAAVRAQAQAPQSVKLPKVQVADIQWALNIAASKAVTMSAMEACQRIKKFLAELDAAEKP